MLHVIYVFIRHLWKHHFFWKLPITVGPWIHYHVGTQGQILGPGDSIRDLIIPDRWRSRLSNHLSSGHWNSPGTQKRAHFLTELPREMYNCISSTNIKGPASNTGVNQWKMKLHTGPKQQNFVIMIFPTVNQRLNPVWPQYTCPKIPKVPPNRIGICYWNSTFRVGMKKIFETTT